MCGRYLIFNEEMNEELEEIIADINRRYPNTNGLNAMATGEVFPTNIAPVMLPDGPKPMRWGFPPVHQRNRPVINARQETAAASPYFGAALAQRRIAVPTAGFYEWMHDEKTKKATDRYRFYLPNEPILYLAGLYSAFTLPNGQKEDRYAILTTAANESMAQYHNRMPVYLKKSELGTWMNDAQCVTDILNRPQPRLSASSVNPKKPVQMSLFG
jgi:Uncharacterized conserved protein